MPRYELMYILNSSISDDEVPQIAQNVLKMVSDYGGTDIEEQQLGKKKLAYPIKKTRNAHYVVVAFTMDGKKINEFDAKIRTQDASIIRYLIANLDEHILRSAKDAVIQASMTRILPVATEEGETPIAPSAESAPKPRKVETVSAVEVNLDEEIEKALTEDIIK